MTSHIPHTLCVTYYNNEEVVFFNDFPIAQRPPLCRVGEGVRDGADLYCVAEVIHQRHVIDGVAYIDITLQTSETASG
jgi:hypothetical protein